MKASLTRIELDLLQTLTRRVRMLTFGQIAASWWPAAGSLRDVRNRLRRLELAGLVENHVVNAHPLLAVDRPLFAWQPGDEDPQCEAIADVTRRRWTQPAMPTLVCVASSLAANLFGSTARSLPTMEHRDHDLRLAAVYVHYRQRLPKLARCWIGEHARPKAGYRQKDPDAFLIDRQGTILRLVESAGRYGQEQVESFHEHCVEHDLPYELW